MKSSFGVQDDIYELLSNDLEILDLLGNPITDEEKNNRFRREMASMDTITVDDLDFISFYFVDALPSRNYKVNRGILTIDYYTSLRYIARKLAERVQQFLSEQTELSVISEGQIPSGITGVFQYRQKFMPLIRG